MHHIGSLAGLAAKALTEQVGDIGLVIYDQNACATRGLPKCKPALMMRPLPLPSAEYGAIEK
jgi:hypothetical protein